MLHTPSQSVTVTLTDDWVSHRHTHWVSDSITVTFTESVIVTLTESDSHWVSQSQWVAQLSDSPTRQWLTHSDETGTRWVSHSQSHWVTDDSTGWVSHWLTQWREWLRVRLGRGCYSFILITESWYWHNNLSLHLNHSPGLSRKRLLFRRHKQVYTSRHSLVSLLLSVLVILAFSRCFYRSCAVAVCWPLSI